MKFDYDRNRYEEVTIKVALLPAHIQTEEEAYQQALRIADRHYEIYSSYRMRRFKGNWHVVFLVKKGYRRP